MAPEPISIIIVEDDTVLRVSLIEYLTLVGHDVTGVGSGREFYRALDSRPFQIAVIDVGLPDQSGLVLTEYVRNNTNMGVIILTALDSDQDLLGGYQAGADVYLVKPVTSRVLESALVRLADRLTAQPPKQPGTNQSQWLIDQATWTLVAPDDGTIQLTDLELKFLKFLATAPGTTIGRDLLTDALYGERVADSGSRALDALVRRLRQKLAALPGSPQPIKSAYSIGFCFCEPIGIR